MLTFWELCFKIHVQEDRLMRKPTYGFIGLGLIGGSIARSLKRADKKITIMAYMRTRSRLEQAKADGTIDVILDCIDERLSECDIIFLCTPVEYNAAYLEKLRPLLRPGAILTDVGSTKTNIHETVIEMNMEDIFIGGHPMAGSEKTGYENSTDHLLENAYYIITPTAKNTDAQIETMRQLVLSLHAIPMILDYREHDFSVAAISHLPHLIASSLVKLVKDNDNDKETMKQIAAGGFKDITRIASSSPVMWEQICMTNAENLKLLIRRYIDSLESIYAELDARDSSAIYELFDESGRYRSSFSSKKRGPVAPDYSFSVDVVDEPGSLAILSAILASRGINVKNIGINNARDYGEGALRISFYEEKDRSAAAELLLKYNYILTK